MAKVVFGISHSEHAGAQVILADLAGAFQERGHSVSMVALYPGRTPPPPPPPGLDWTHCLTSWPRSPADAARAIQSAARHIGEADAVFAALPAANVVFAVASRLRRRPPLVFTTHHSPAFTYNPLYRRLDAIVGATRAVTGTICVSKTVQDSLSSRTRAYQAKSIVIRNALPPAIERLTQRLRVERRARRPGRTVIACGRLAAQKNYPVLIRAIARLPDATLTIVGSGPDEAALKGIAFACGVAEQVSFTGSRSREETLALISQAGVFAQPSLFEGHSLALVEAASVGIPMVVSSVPSQLEGATRSDGVLCALAHEAQDDEALAACLSSLLDEGGLRDCYSGLSASLGNEIRFSRMVEKYAALLRGGAQEPR